jgi:hypothetical protein
MWLMARDGEWSDDEKGRRLLLRVGGFLLTAQQYHAVGPLETHDL